MSGLIINETIKIYRRRLTQVLLILLAFITIGVFVFGKIHTPAAEDWRTETAQLVQSYEERLKITELAPTIHADTKNKLKIAVYRLENNIPSIPDNPWSAMLNFSGLVEMVMIFAIIIAADMVAGEYASGTMKLLLIRQHTNVPILFLTARAGDLDKLTGLAIGGDDYITKPFNPLEVVARVNVQFRRREQYQNAPQAAEIYHFGAVTIDRNAAQLWVNGQEMACPAKEFELLLFLANHPNRVFTAAQLYEKVWGAVSIGDEKTVAIHIMRLREKNRTRPQKFHAHC